MGLISGVLLIIFVALSTSASQLQAQSGLDRSGTLKARSQHHATPLHDSRDLPITRRSVDSPDRSPTSAVASNLSLRSKAWPRARLVRRMEKGEGQRQGPEQHQGPNEQQALTRGSQHRLPTHLRDQEDVRLVQRLLMAAAAVGDMTTCERAFNMFADPRVGTSASIQHAAHQFSRRHNIGQILRTPHGQDLEHRIGRRLQSFGVRGTEHTALTYNFVVYEALHEQYRQNTAPAAGLMGKSTFFNVRQHLDKELMRHAFQTIDPLQNPHDADLLAQQRRAAQSLSHRQGTTPHKASRQQGPGQQQPVHEPSERSHAAPTVGRPDLPPHMKVIRERLMTDLQQSTSNVPTSPPKQSKKRTQSKVTPSSVGQDLPSQRAPKRPKKQTKVRGSHVATEVSERSDLVWRDAC